MQCTKSSESRLASPYYLPPSLSLYSQLASHLKHLSSGSLTRLTHQQNATIFFVTNHDGCHLFVVVVRVAEGRRTQRLFLVPESSVT